MKTTTILHEYERRLNLRLARGEITEATRDTYINDASRIFEVLLRHIPSQAIEGFMESEGYRGEYIHIIGSLNTIAREHGHLIFPQVPLPTDPTPNAPAKPTNDQETP
jgi:hypothetical protein